MPGIIRVPGNVAGRFDATPLGILLHGTRSGQPWTLAEEFSATVNYVIGGAAGLGWACTVGEGTIALHLGPDEWGWHARNYSPTWLGVEFAQPSVDYEITDSQLDTFAWWFRTIARARWPQLDAHFLGHSESSAGIADGKTDPYRIGSFEMDRLRHRILARL